MKIDYFKLKRNLLTISLGAYLVLVDAWASAIIGGKWSFTNGKYEDTSENNNLSHVIGDASVYLDRLYLNGGGAMRIDKSTSLSPSQSVFIEFDLSLKSFGSHWIIDNMSDDYMNGYLIRTTDGKTLDFYVGNGKASANVSAPIVKNTPYHVEVIFDGSFLAIYLDGVVHDWKPFAGSISYDDTESIYVGARKGNSQFMDGWITNLTIGTQKALPLSVASLQISGIVPERPFHWQLEAIGGMPPYRFFSSDLPNGFSLNSTTGVMSGTIQNLHSVTQSVSIRVIDSLMNSSVPRTYFTHVTPRLGDNFRLISSGGTSIHATTSKRTDPQIIHYKGTFDRTYAVFQGLQLNPEISSFDSQALKWTSPVVGGVNPWKQDQHGHPSIIADAKGHLHVFYGTHFSPLKHAVTMNPEDTSLWSQQEDVVQVATYPNAHVMPDGELILFYRGYKTYEKIHSLDGGKSWKDNQVIANWGENFTIYPDTGIFYDAKSGIFHLAYSVYDYSSSNHYGIFYAKSLDRGKTWVDSNGVFQSLPLAQFPKEAVFDPGNVVTYGTDLIVDKDGEPVILFTSAPIGASDQAKVFVSYHRNGRWHFKEVGPTWNTNIGGVLHLSSDKDSISVYYENREKRLEKKVFSSQWSLLLDEIIEPFPDKTASISFPKLITSSPEKIMLFFQAYFDSDRSYVISYQDTEFSSDRSERLIELEPKDSQCFIAAATRGSGLDSEVKEIRQFRDRILSKFYIGQKVICLYYKISPHISKTVSNSYYIRFISQIFVLILASFIRYPVITLLCGWFASEIAVLCSRKVKLV